MRLLEGKIAVVTGSAKGIGAQTALALAQHGASGIAVADVMEEAGRETCRRIEAETGARCLFVRTDVSNREDVDGLFDAALRQWGTVDILYNCAGIVTTNTLEQSDEAAWDRVMDINLKGTFLCSRRAYGIMKDKRSGRIINTASISGRIGGIASGVEYIASKGGVIALTKGLAKKAAQYGITVNAVSPGFVLTDMAKNFSHFDPASVPLGYIAGPAEIADVVVFLASDLSRYMTGCTLDVTGGVYMS
jgi:3-oxoacyl-[acyl-carrier protein] reductase